MEPVERHTPKGTVLIVDDTPSSLRILVEMLSEQGYTVYPAAEGKLALRFAATTPPDLIVLDVMMPDMDGYEVCQRLKSDERTRDIPVIFISAADQVLDKVKAFSSGGVDYITKPFQTEEVLARIQTHMALQRLQKNLETQVRQRTRELEAINARLKEEITERERAESAEHEQRILAEALRDTAAALTSTLDTGSIMACILDNAGRVVAHDRANIMLIEGDAARFARWNNYPAHYESFFNTFRLPLTTPHLREMLSTAAPVVIDDTETYEGWVNIPDLSLARSYIGVPIRVHDRVIGFLNLDSAQPGYFSATHVERLQAFADQAAIALENAQLYEEIRRHAGTLEQQVLERTNELDQERARLQAILEEMAEAVMYIDLATRQTQYVNRAFAELTGYPPQAFIAQPLRIYKGLLDVPAEYDKLALMLERIVLQRVTWRGKFRAHRQDGIPLELELAASVVPGPGEQVAGVVILARDIGPERALQAQKDRFITNASHELRTPITNLTLRLYLARREPEKWQEYLPILENTANHMATLVESLLEVSRFERGLILLEQQSVILQEIIAAAVVENQPQADGKHIQITSKLQDEPLYVYADPTRIRQVVDNLIINAINYTPDGGQINIEAFAEQNHGAAFAVFRVQDTGVGMTPEQIARLFEPFFRVSGTKTQGTGLGLSIAKEIVDMHGGKIAAESEKNKGSVFSVALPLENHEA